MAFSPNDFGPIYAETDFSRFPVEPWNAGSNLIFLALAIYWGYRTRLNSRHHPLLAIGLPILLIGFIGGTMFHATRSHQMWLYMDFIPIFVLAISAAAFFWLSIFENKFLTVILVIGPFFCLQLLRTWLPIHRPGSISIGYSILSLIVLVPAIVHCTRFYPKGWWRIFSAAICIAIGLTFRQLDRTLAATLLPMGSHFLWHIFGGLSAYFLMSYVFLSDLARVKEQIAVPTAS